MRRKLDKETLALAEEMAGLSALEGVSRDAVEALAVIGRVVHVPPSWALLSESQPADSCYLLLDGEVEVRVHGEPVATLEHGALFGEAALVQHRTRNASVVTKSDVRAVRLAFDDLVPVLGSHPEVEQAFKAEWEKRAAT
jgi:CRP/FNR family transcriptional regulator, cyclic AMP receptor protein